MSSATNVHREHPGFTSLSEFIGGSHDDCGPDAELAALAGDNEMPLSAGSLAAIDKRDTVAGWFNGGEPISAVYNDLQRFLPKDKILAYFPFAQPLSDPAFHDALKQYAGMPGVAIVVEFAAAHNLTGNEGGVNYHFVAIGGIDSQTGYLVANGDDVRALGPGGQGTYAPRWLGWDILASAIPCGAVIWEAAVSSPTPAPAPAPGPKPSPLPPQSPPTPPPAPTPAPQPAWLADARGDLLSAQTAITAAQTALDKLKVFMS
ncbi:MAG TPA: hypothetical protein VMV29_24145 [Ktedonobacterales bacterium]|nr:hypothetical protein [Ktedonobacterales bacterium]